MISCEVCGKESEHVDYRQIRAPEVSNKPIVSNAKMCDECYEKLLNTKGEISKRQFNLIMEMEDPIRLDDKTWKAFECYMKSNFRENKIGDNKEHSQIVYQGKSIINGDKVV